MKCICAVTKNYAIGKDNDLLFKLKADLKFFKKITLGETLIMGEKTFYSIPFTKDGQFLPGRKKIVLSHNTELIQKYQDWSDIEFVSKVDKDFLEKYKDAFVIGGGYTYRQFASFFDTVYLTHIDEEVEGATVFFPSDLMQFEFELMKWKTEDLEEHEEDDVKFKMVKYTRVCRFRETFRILQDSTKEPVRFLDLKVGDIIECYQEGKSIFHNESKRGQVVEILGPAEVLIDPVI